MVSGSMVAAWSPTSLRHYYDALHKHGPDWEKVAAELTEKSVDMCETLYKQHQTFLGLPASPALATAFVAMVQDHYNNMKEEGTGAQTAGPGSTAAAETKQEEGGEGAVNGHGAAHQQAPDEEQHTTEGAHGEPHEAEDEGTSNQLPSQRSKRTPKPTAKALASTPLSKRGAAGMSPKSANRVRSPDQEPGSARKRRQRRLFDEPDEPAAQPYGTRWKAPARHDDFGDGVDALLSLATAAHNARTVSSSINEAVPQASVTPAVTVATEPSAAGGTTGTATEGAAMETGGADGEEAEGGGGGRGAGSRGGVGAVSQVVQSVMSPSKSKGASGRGTPGGSGNGTAGKASPRRAPTKGAKSNRSARSGGGRFKRSGARKRGGMYASDSSDGEAGDLGDQGPMTVPMLRASSAASQLPRSTGLGKRGAEGHRGGSHKRQAQRAGNDSGDLMAADPVMGMLPLESGADFYGYDMGAGALPLNMSGHLDYARSLDGTPLPPVSTNLGGLACLPIRQRRRKPIPERLAVMSPVIKALLPGGVGGSGGGGAGRAAAAASTPTASAAAAAAAAALSPGLLGSPSFLQGINMAMLAVSDPLASLSEASLRHCLASPRLRRWVAFEFQVSAMDRPWFLRNELVELVSALCGGGPVPQQLTRPEWALIRGAFGRPRRLSLQFLKEERVKLEAYREHVRRVYEQAASGGPPVPPELPQPLRVGQAVVARHPTTRQLHDGTLLTVMGSRCRVQFNRSELMTEVVRDVDIMPVDPYENLPLSLPVVPLVLNGRPRPLPGTLNRRRAVSRLIPRGAPADTGRVVPGSAGSGGLGFSGGLGILGIPGSGGGSDGGALDAAADEALTTEVTNLLEEKEATVAKLRRLNDEAEAAKLGADQGHSEAFQQAYSKVVLRLKEVNSKLEPLLERLSGRARHASLITAAAAAPGSVPQSLPGASAQGAAGLADLSSPLAAVPPGSAMARPSLGEFQPDASGVQAEPDLSAGMGADAGTGVAGASGTRAPEATNGQLSGLVGMLAGDSGDHSLTAAMAAVTALVPQGGGTAMSDSATVASAIVAAAMSEARSLVEQTRGGLAGVQAIKMDDNSTGGISSLAALSHLQGMVSTPEAEAPSGSSPLARLVTSCLAMLLTMQQCTGEAVSGPVSEQALDSAVRMLQPVSASNEDKFARIVEHVQLLKAQLSCRG